MAIKRISNEPKSEQKTKRVRAKASEMKLLAKAYVDANPELDGKDYFVFSGKVTEKGFLLLQCKDFCVLCPAGTEEASNLLDNILPNLNGKKGYRLVAVLNRLNRFGAYLAINDEHSCYYAYDSTEETFITSTEPVKKSAEKVKAMTLEDFGTLTE